MDQLVFDLMNLNQYKRLDWIQHHLNDIQDSHVDSMLYIAQNLLNDGNLELSTDISKLTILCAIVLENPKILARVETFHAKLLFKSGDNQSAIHYSLQSINCLRRVYVQWSEIKDFFIDEDFDFGVALVLEKDINRFEPFEAISLLVQNIEPLYKKYGYQLGEGRIQWLLGNAYKQINQFQDAFTCYSYALQSLRKFEINTTELLLSLSYVCSQLNQLDKAQLYLDEVEKIFNEENNELGIAVVSINRAAIFNRQGHKRELLRMYRKAYLTFQQHNQIKDLSFVEMEIAALLLIYPGHQDQSIEYLELAIETFKIIGNKLLLAKAHEYLAVLYFNKGENGKAKDLLMEIVENDHSDISMDTLWQSYYILGKIDLSYGELRKSYENFQKALEVIDKVRKNLRAEDLIIDFLNIKPNFYEPLVSLAMKLNEPINALGWIEQSKSRAFLHILGNMKLTYQSDNTELFEQLNEVDCEIAFLEKTIASRSEIESTEIINNWYNIRNRKICKRDQLYRELQIHNSEIVSLINVQAISWEELKDILSNM